MTGLERLPYEERLRDLELLILKTEGDLISAYKYLVGESQDSGARLFGVVSSNRTKGNVFKMKHKKFHLHMRRKIPYCEGGKALEQTT